VLNIYITKQRENHYNRFITIKSAFEVGVKNAGDSPCHAAAGTIQSKHTLEQADGMPGFKNCSRDQEKEKRDNQPQPQRQEAGQMFSSH